MDYREKSGIRQLGDAMILQVKDNCHFHSQIQEVVVQKVDNHQVCCGGKTH
jgi:hypothetical protein